MLRSALARWCSFVVLSLTSASACVFEPTQVVVTVDTDLPESVSSVLRFCVSREGGGRPRCSEVRRGAPLGDGAVARLPGSFTVVPFEGGARDEQVTVTIELRPVDLTRAPLTRSLRFRLIPRRSLQARVFLSTRCSASTVGCASATPDPCTIARRCEEQGLTCGDDATCISPQISPAPFDPRMPGSELDVASPPDSNADDRVTFDARSDGALEDTGIRDAADGDSGVCMASGPCTPAACQMGERRCVDNVAQCVATGFVAAGVACGDGTVCNGMGACIPCSNGAACMLSTPCRTGQITCASGAATCTATGMAPAGTMCGPTSVCSSTGTCVPCTPGATCTPTGGGPCARGTISCASGAPVCVGGGVAPVDTPCPGGICNASGMCVPCIEGGACGVANQCDIGIVRCAGGRANCMVRPAPAGTMCNDGNPCTGPPDRCDGFGNCVGGTPFSPYENRSTNPAANGGDGVCILERYYCSPTGAVIPMSPPGGYYGGGGGINCEYHGCMGHLCQVNFCKSCASNCAANCP